MHSFRARLLMGSLLAALGLLGAAHLISLAVIRHYPVTIRFTHVEFLGGLALVLIIAGLIQVLRGLSPFDELRERLAGVREGKAARIEGIYPSEVQPLVSDLNELLDQRGEQVRRAIAKAGDLAHGLKTPLAVLAHEADRAAAAGQGEVAEMIRQQVERMRRQVDYHLAHARAAASGVAPGVRCQVLASVEGLSRTLMRLHAERGLAIDVQVSPDHYIRGERQDLDEMLGNLLDNACKWAASQVSVASIRKDSRVVVTVEDDGTGVAPEMRDVVLRRGVRADQAAPGSGFGLAIVSDLTELYGGSLSLEESPAGGLRVRLELPSA